MKKLNRILCLCLAVAMCFVTVGCKNKEKERDLKDPEVLNITMPDLGYGTEWMKSVADGFTEKTGTKVQIAVSPTESNYVTAMRAGTAKYDIYVLRANTYDLVVSNAANYSGYECILADLDDVYNSELEEGVLFKDKMKDMYEQYNRVDAKNDGNYHYYAVQWCDSVFSLVRNKKVWQDNWQIPNTTDELLALAKQIKSEGKTPFIWSSQATYWWQVANIWVSQYQGWEDMYGDRGFWKGYDEQGNVNVPEMWARKGILEAMKVLDELVRERGDNNKDGYQHVLSTTVDFTTAQGYFLTESNNIAMMANGDWLYNEMKKNYSSASVDMIKMPVISAIRNHADCEGTIESDEELSALVKAIDEGKTDLVGDGYNVSQKAFDKVAGARNLYTCATNINHIMVSPVYSDSLPQVKAFYKYLASDEGLIKFASANGFTLGFKTSDAVKAASDAAANDFVKCTEAIKRDREVAPWPVYTSRLFSLGGMSIWPTNETGYSEPERIFALRSGEGYMNATDLWKTNYNNVKNKWSVFMQNAGLNK